MFIYTDLSVNDTPAPPSATQIHAIHRDPSCDAGDAAHQLRRAESRKFYWGRAKGMDGQKRWRGIYILGTGEVQPKSGDSRKSPSLISNRPGALQSGI